MITLVPKDGSDISLESIASHGDQHLPRFALPRYFEISGELPKTPTGKVQKEKTPQKGNSRRCVGSGGTIGPRILIHPFVLVIKAIEPE